MVVWGWGAVGRREGQLHGYGVCLGSQESAGTSVVVMLHNISECAKTHHVLQLKTVKWGSSLTVQRSGPDAVTAKGVGSVRLGN